MKSLPVLLMLCFTIGLSAQNNQPSSHLTRGTTGTESITGNAASTIKAPAINPDGSATTAADATRTTGSTPTNNIYGRNNDGSSTGTTVSGHGSTSGSAPVDDHSPHPGNKGGSMIITPRGR